MAPPYLGSGPSCSPHAFESERSRREIAFYAVYLVVYTILLCVGCIRRPRPLQDKSFLLALLSIICAIADIFLSIIFRILDYCNHYRFLIAISYGYTFITWFNLIASYLLLALILVPFCRRLHGGSRAVKGVTIVTAGYLGILAAVLVSTLAIYTHIARAALPNLWYYIIENGSDRALYSSIAQSVLPSPWYYTTEDGKNLANHLLRLFWAYYTLEVVGMLLAGTIVVSALVHAVHMRKGSLLVCFVLVIFGALGMTLVHLGGCIEHTFGESSTENPESAVRSKDAQRFLGCFFYSVTFLSAVLAMTSSQLDIPQQDPELVSNNDYHQVADGLNQNVAEKQPAYDEETKANGNKRPEWRDGWKFTVFLAFIASLVVLCFNLGFLLWAIIRDQLEHYQGTLYEGDCDQVQKISTGFHLLINTLSTILLGSSNYGMQCLCAPTRKDIDRAHRNKRWLDIGVPSLQNLSHVSAKRSILWACLALSSLPIHLVYNSAVFKTKSANAYNVFAGGELLGQDDLADLDFNFPKVANISFARLHQKAQKNELKRLDSSQCLDAYAVTYQITYGSLLLVTDDVQTSSSYTFISTQDVFDPFAYLRDTARVNPYEWLCADHAGHDCSTLLPGIRDQAKHNNWTVAHPPNNTYRVKYCLGEKMQEHCKLQYSLPLTVLIIAFNVAKACILGYITFSKAGSPILTTGDSIASFLRRPDPFTRGRCLLSRRAIERLHWAPPKNNNQLICDPLEFTNERKRWCSAVSVGRWAFGVISWLVAIAICCTLLAYGLSEAGNGSDIWEIGLEEASSQTLIKGDYWPTKLIPNVIIANCPQLAFSVLYFAFNNVLTAMCLSAEWSRYAQSRKGLRISHNPQSSQRSSYFLSLPYHYAVPLMVVSALLHWLISQSLFLVGIEAYDSNGARNPSRDLRTCGYAPPAIVSGISVGVAMFVCMIGLGLRRFASSMPVAGCCSLAISAACHPGFDPNCASHNTGDGMVESKLDGEYMALLPVKWGAVQLEGAAGHCTFSAEDVEFPKEGQIYQ